jgi:hypothetical protein
VLLVLSEWVGAVLQMLMAGVVQKMVPPPDQNSHSEAVVATVSAQLGQPYQD